MKRSGRVPSLGCEFDDFLLAPIGEDNNGMLLSVLSALARSGVDPWTEAATLTRLPEDNATRKLAALIAALPAGPSARPDPAAIAARLISLLPCRAGSRVPLRPMPSGSASMTRSPLVRYLVFYVIFALIMLASQWLIGSPQAPAQTNRTSTVSTSSGTAQPPAPRGGQ